MEPGQVLQGQIEALAGGRIKPGDELLVLGLAGLSGTREFCRKYREKLQNRFSPAYIRKMEAPGCEEEIRLRKTEQEKSEEEIRQYILYDKSERETSFPARAVFPLREGGILAGLWILSQASHVGLSVDLRMIPLKQETIELCEYLGLNPYRLSSGGAWLLAAEDGFYVTQKLKAEGLSCTRIGTAQEGKKKLLYNGQNIQYLEKPSAEELQQLLRQPCPVRK